MTDLDDWLPAITAGDADAFGAWMAGAEPALRDRLRCFASRVDTEAVLQETLLRLWQLAPRFERDGKPNGLLRLGFVVARNLALSECRRLRSSPVEPQQLAETLGGAEARPPDPLLRGAIQRCRDRLPRQPALALEARLRSGGAEPDEALARGLRMRTNTFLQNFGRARKLLVECLRRLGVDLEAELA